MTYEDNYLAHHGIKGQQWGIRRFQNPDGTYTPEGRTRYGRGKNVSREHSETFEKEYARLKKENKAKEDKLYKRIHDVVTRYELDGDDGGGGNYEKFSEAELTKAKKQFWDLNTELDNLYEETRSQSLDYANKRIIKKYGQTAIDDMRHYNSVKTGLTIGALLSAVGAITVFSLKE